VKFKEPKQYAPIKNQMDESKSDEVPKQLALPIAKGPAWLLTSQQNIHICEQEKRKDKL